MKRRYIGFCVVKNTVMDYCEDGVRTTHTANQIAKAHQLNAGSVRIAAKHMGIVLKTDVRGGRRSPCNQYEKSKQSPSVEA